MLAEKWCIYFQLKKYDPPYGGHFEFLAKKGSPHHFQNGAPFQIFLKHHSLRVCKVSHFYHNIVVWLYTPLPLNEARASLLVSYLKSCYSKISKAKNGTFFFADCPIVVGLMHWLSNYYFLGYYAFESFLFEKLLPILAKNECFWNI